VARNNIFNQKRKNERVRDDLCKRKRLPLMQREHYSKLRSGQKSGITEVSSKEKRESAKRGFVHSDNWSKEKGKNGERKFFKLNIIIHRPGKQRVRVIGY